MIKVSELEAKEITSTLSSVFENYSACYVPDESLLIQELANDEYVSYSQYEDTEVMIFSSLHQLAKHFDLENNSTVYPVDNIHVNFVRAVE